MAQFLNRKRRVNFILRNWVKYYTKEAMKTLKLVTIGSAIVITVVCIKYRPAYKVTISGETIGYIEDRNLIEKKIEKYMNNTSGNIAFREITKMPEYELKLVNRETELKDKDVMLAVEKRTTTTYRFFGVTSDGEQKAVVSSQEEAESIINEIKSDLVKDVDLKLGIVEVYTTDNNVNTKETATNALNEIKVAKVTEYKNKKAEEARKKAAAARAKSFASIPTGAATGHLNGLALAIPVNGSISSRFGSRGASRSSIHTGLDISTSSGTGIRPIAAGTVTYAAYKGSYGYLVIIDHGNGVQSYYAHCSALYVSAGQAVGPNSTIAAVGSTGNSTGPHLHLEIRVNGAPVNPQNYIY